MYGHDMHSLYSFTSAIDRTVSSVDSAISRAMAVANSKDPLHQAQEGLQRRRLEAAPAAAEDAAAAGILIQAAQSGTCS